MNVSTIMFAYLLSFCTGVPPLFASICFSNPFIVPQKCQKCLKVSVRPFCFFLFFSCVCNGRCPPVAHTFSSIFCVFFNVWFAINAHRCVARREDSGLLPPRTPATLITPRRSSGPCFPHFSGSFIFEVLLMI